MSGFLPTNQNTLYLLFLFYSDNEIITVCGRPVICILIGWFNSSCLLISLLDSVCNNSISSHSPLDVFGKGLRSKMLWVIADIS